MKAKAIALVSTGIDSPVAVHIMKQKGMDIVPLFFINKSRKEIDTVKSLLKTLGIKKLLVADHKKNQEEFLKSCNTRFQCILCKRLMYRVARKVMGQYGCDYLITGENLSQVASQTLDNMKTLNDSIDINVIRPLLCYDKNEIIAIAREIGTFGLSVKDISKCPFVPTNPATSSSSDKIKVEESKIDLDNLINQTLDTLEELSI